MLPGQTVQDRPDLVSRVFQLKKKYLLDLIFKDNIFRKTVAHVYTIEFQKKGVSQTSICSSGVKTGFSASAPKPRAGSEGLASTSKGGLLWEGWLLKRLVHPCLVVVVVQVPYSGG
jgi:Helitron helicase-like domain at N-terminus